MIWLLAAVGVLGMAVGDVLAGVVWRLSAGQPGQWLILPCPSCAATRRPREFAGALARYLLRTRCRHCRARIGEGEMLLPLATVVVFVLLASRIGARPDLPAFLYLGAIGVALTAIDLACQRLPDVLTLPSYPVGIGLLALGLLGRDSSADLLRAVLGMAAFFGLYFLIALISPGGLGFGDVKLAGVVGLYLAWLSWGTWAVGLFAGFVLGGLTAVGLLLIGRAGRSTALPFGPFMLLGALVAILGGEPIARSYLDLAIR